MKIQFLNTIPLQIISGGNIYNNHIIEGLKHQGINVDYSATPLNKDYDGTIVDSLFMKNGLAKGINSSKPIIGLVHQIPKLDNNTLDFYRTNAKFVVTGEPTKQKLSSNWQVDDKNITVIRPGVPCFWKTKTVFSPKPKRIILIANFIQNKGFELLIRLLENLEPHDVEFSIIGNNTLDPIYAKTVIDSIQKTKANVEFYFNISRDEVHRQLLKSDIFLSLSKSETFGMATFEALSVGLPSITYRTGDFEYFKTFTNYIIVDDYSENAFVENIKELVFKPEVYASYCTSISKNKREWYQVINDFSTYVKNTIASC